MKYINLDLRAFVKRLKLECSSELSDPIGALLCLGKRVLLDL